MLKKTNIDPTNPKNYRPIVISTTFSKLLEIHILQESGEHEFHDLQFGFIGNRGTSMAAALTHDVLDYCTANKSPVYLCALDAESAFDGIPHAVMFQKALKVVPPLLWRILVYWYSRLTVIIKWGNAISNPISVSIGTRQGGLSCPFIFHIFYQDLVKMLSSKPCRINIDGVSYNVCCYADDLLLSSLSIPGLQTLIDKATDYITMHGLKFNPSKTKCMTFGKSKFDGRQWFLNGEMLVEEQEIIHLGIVLANDHNSHAKSCTQAMRKAFYALQGSGLCQHGCNPATISHIFKAAVQPVLTYGMECVFQSKSALHLAQSAQTKLLKASLGLKTSCKSSPLLQALIIIIIIVGFI